MIELSAMSTEHSILTVSTHTQLCLNYQILFLVCRLLWTVAVGGGGGYERVVQCRVVGSLQNCVLVSLTQLWGRQDVRAFTTVKPKSFT